MIHASVKCLRYRSELIPTKCSNWSMRISNKRGLSKAVETDKKVHALPCPASLAMCSSHDAAVPTRCTRVQRFGIDPSLSCVGCPGVPTCSPVTSLPAPLLPNLQTSKPPHTRRYWPRVRPFARLRVSTPNSEIGPVLHVPQQRNQ